MHTVYNTIILLYYNTEILKYYFNGDTTRDVRSNNNNNIHLQHYNRHQWSSEKNIHTRTSCIIIHASYIL